MTPEPDGSSSPVSEKQPFWGRLVPGPYAVGYHSSFQLDYARSYDLFFPEHAPFTAAKQPRPILVNVWYPARRDTHAEPMRQGDYLQIASQEPLLKNFSERLAAFQRDLNDEGLMGKPRSQLNAVEQAALDQFWQTPTAAIRDAPTEEGRFPLVLDHQGYGGNVFGNTALFEFLASHGYVVISSAFQGEDPAELRVGHDMNRSMKDLTFLLHHMQRHPQVDMERIGLIGESYGAQAVLSWVAEANPAVGAVVSLDTTLEYLRPEDEEVHLPREVRVNVSLRDVRTRFDQAPRLSTPLLIFTQARLAPDFWLYEKLPHTERYYAQIKFVSHLDLGSLTAACRRLRPPADREPGVGDTEQIQEANEEICWLILRFFDAYLKADQQALSCLKKGGEAAPNAEDGAQVVTWQYRKAEPLPPTSSTDGQDGRNCHQEREHGDDKP